VVLPQEKDKVTAEKNLGDHLNAVKKDRMQMKAVPHQQLTLELETKHVKTYLLNNLAFVFLRRLLGWFLPRKLGILLPSQL